MEPLESPRVQQVGGVLSRGEATDGERTDDEMDYRSESFISQLEGDEDEEDSAEELEVTGEGTAGGPFGLKKVLFVRKKSDKGAQEFQQDPNKPQETLKDRFSKLGAGVGERFAALGSIIQDHGKSPGPDKVAGEASSDEANDRTRQVLSTPDPQPTTPKQAMEYFQEYEMTFTSKPGFSVVEGPGGKGAMVSWPSKGDEASAAENETAKKVLADDDGLIPPSGAIIIAVAGEPVVGAALDDVAARVMGEGEKTDLQAQDAATADAAEDTEEKPETTLEADDGADKKEKDGPFPLVVRFREKAEPRHGGTHGGGEVFRSRMKAMATGFGNLFQGKEAGGSSLRDGSDVSSGVGVSGAATAAAATVMSDAFVLTFAAESGTAEELPFALAEMVGGRGAIVSEVREDYASTLAQVDASVVSAAGMASVIAAEEPIDCNAETGAVPVEVLAPGAVLLRVAGQNVEGKPLECVRKALGMAAAEHSAVRILFRRAPLIYRKSVAAELSLEGSKVPHVHVGTWQPLLKRRAGVTLGGSNDEDNGGNGGGAGVIGIGYGGEEWEDVRETMARAQEFLNGFRSIGVRVDVISIQTVTLPKNHKSAYAGVFEGRSSSFQQAVRLWFRFSDERTVSLRRGLSTSEKLGLTHLADKGKWALGSWVLVTAEDASPCAEAGIPVGESSILTHVNGFDVSPAAYRSLAPLPFGEGEGWAAAVLPAIEGGGETIRLTFV